MDNRFRDTGHFETSALNDLKIILNTTRSKVFYMCVANVEEFQISPNFLCDCFQDTKLSISEMHQMPSEWPWILNSQKYPVYIKYLPPRFKFLSLSLYDQLFSRYKVVKNRKIRKCTDWSQTDLEYLTIKKYPFFRFALRPAVSEMQGLLKVENFGNVPNDLRLTLKS